MLLSILRMLVCLVLILATINQQSVWGQENAQTSIPNSLIECYANPEIYERDFRLPATINTLIDLIRKIEENPDYQDIHRVAVGVLHRFRMDGIERAPGNYQPGVLTYSPSGYQFSKHRLLLSRLIPGNANNFPNNTLSAVERCSLHFLLSSSIETRIRGDESTRCGQLAQLRSSRVHHPFDLYRKRREAPGNYFRNNYLCDIEMTDENDRNRCKRYRTQHLDRRPYYSRPRTTTPPTTQIPYDPDYETEGDEHDYHYDPTDQDYHYDSSPMGRGLVDVASNSISQCPVENGVIRTVWGAVAAGPLIAGIAAGLVQQNVAIRELLKLTRFYNMRPNRQQVQLNIDNRWAATLAGDLAEVTLLQGPLNREVSVGAAGAWNSTTVPHWYFLSQRERLEQTDAEIRGGIDGLVLGLNVDEWRRQTSQLRLSQLLDMYYSNRGVFSSDIRSCNRRGLFTKFVQPNQLLAQTIGFSTVLDREMQLRVTLTNSNIEQFSTNSAETLRTYVANGLNDVSCDAVSNLDYRTASDLHIFIDTTWQFIEVQPAIATVLDNIDVNRFGTRYTLYNTYDGSVIVNTTSSLSDFYTLWNRTSHQSLTSGFNLAAVVKQLRVIGTGLLEEARAQTWSGGRSFISLVVPQLSAVNEADSNYVIEQLYYLREVQPDMTLLFWASGSVGRFASYVVDQNRDLFQFTTYGESASSGGQEVYTNALRVIQRIQSVPRRIVNPRCTTDWQQSDWGSNTLEQYIEPNGVNFYRLHPNYFYHSNSVIRVQSRFQSQIAVCFSRHVEQPRFSNTTQQENVECKQLLTTQSFDYYLTNACDGYFTIHSCPPVYFSIQIAPQATQNSFQCGEPNCRFPDEVKVSITLENLGCYSSTSMITSKMFIIVFGILSHILFKMLRISF